MKLQTVIIPRGRHAVYFRRDTVPPEEGLLVDPAVMEDPTMPVEVMGLFVYISGTVLATGKGIELEDLPYCKHKSCRKDLIQALRILEKKGLIKMTLRVEK